MTTKKQQQLINEVAKATGDNVAFAEQDGNVVRYGKIEQKAHGEVVKLPNGQIVPLVFNRKQRKQMLKEVQRQIRNENKRKKL